jgi:hypothetical protein
MRDFHRRLDRLGARWCVGPETAEQTRAREAAEKLHQRIVAGMIRIGWDPAARPALAPGLSIGERLVEARKRARQRLNAEKAAEESAASV